MLLRTQKCIIHCCMLSVQLSMTIFVLNFGGQLVHLDMATSFWTSSRGRPGFDPGDPNVNVCPKIFDNYGKRQKMILELPFSKKSLNSKIEIGITKLTIISNAKNVFTISWFWSFLLLKIWQQLDSWCKAKWEHSLANVAMVQKFWDCTKNRVFTCQR